MVGPPQEQRSAPSGRWESLLAATASIMYHLPADSFRDYTNFRVKAMLLRDEKGDSITQKDWQKINEILLQAWQSFSNTVKQKREV